MTITPTAAEVSALRQAWFEHFTAGAAAYAAYLEAFEAFHNINIDAEATR
tara:strand:- start:4462 stop:4611 length:150 start_codon:yes stop_codon:yes gene_type:complete